MADTKRISGELLKGHLPTLVLSVLASEPAHGYAIMQQLERRSKGVFALGQGTVYPLLYGMEQQGLIRSKTQTVSGRQRRVYSATRKGRKRMQEGRQQWKAFQSAMNAVLAPC